MLTEGKIANWFVDFAPPGPAVEARMWLPKRLDFSNDVVDDDEAKVTKLQAQNKVGGRQQKKEKEKNGDLLIYTTTYIQGLL